LFNPTPQRAVQPAWTPEALLQPVSKGDGRFAAQDWEGVPRLDYHTEQFRQLAVPDPARVVEDVGGFEAWTPKQLGTAKFLNESEALKADAEAKAAAARALTLAEAADVAQAQADAPFVPDARLNPVTDMEDADTSVLDSHAGPSADEGEVPGPDTLAPESAQADAAPDGDMVAVAPEAEVGDDAVNAPPPDDAALPLSSGDATPSETPQDKAPAQENPAVDAPQALDSEAVQQACETARQEGHAQGLNEGREAALAEANTQAREALEAALLQADLDKANALQALREELEAEFEPIKRQLGKLVEQVQSLVAQPDSLYEPIKRLSIHLAEQLVLGELNLSSAPVERLIQRCLDELDLHGNPALVVELNPQDKARLQDHVGELAPNLTLQAVHTLQPGSVRVVVNDTMVEDLVGTRLEALARGLLVQPEAWREQSPFFRQPLAQRDTEVQDAAARKVAPSVSSGGREPAAPRAMDGDETNQGEQDA